MQLASVISAMGTCVMWPPLSPWSRFTSPALACRYVTEGCFRVSHRAEKSPEGLLRAAATLPGWHICITPVAVFIGLIYNSDNTGMQVM